MSFGNHTFDQIGERSCCINGSLAIIVASDKESGCEAVFLESIEKGASELCWSIIVSECNYIILNAIVDVFGVCDRSFLWAWCIGCGSPGWCCVAITTAETWCARAWVGAVIDGSTTESYKMLVSIVDQGFKGIRLGTYQIASSTHYLSTLHHQS